MAKFTSPKRVAVRVNKHSNLPHKIGEEKHKNKSYIYGATNKFMPGICKIGFSNDVESRMKELFTTGVPVPHQIAWKVNVNDKSAVEKLIHQYLHGYRIRSDREYFNLDADEAFDILFRNNEMDEFVSIDLEPVAGEKLIYLPNERYICKVVEQDYFEFDRFRESYEEFEEKKLDIVVLPESPEEEICRVKSGGDIPTTSLRELTRKLMGISEHVNPLPFWRLADGCKLSEFLIHQID